MSPFRLEQIHIDRTPDRRSQFITLAISWLALQSGTASFTSTPEVQFLRNTLGYCRLSIHGVHAFATM